MKEKWSNIRGPFNHVLDSLRLERVKKIDIIKYWPHTATVNHQQKLQSWLEEEEERKNAQMKNM